MLVSSGASANSQNYLQEIQFQSLALMIESVTRMMWDVDEKLKPAQISQAAALKVCRYCRAVVREKLRDHAATIVENLQLRGVPRKTWKQTAEDFNTDLQGFRMILEGLRAGTMNLQVSDYWNHVMAMTTDGPNVLWQTPAARGLVKLPSTSKELACTLSGECELPPENAFTPLQVGTALYRFYDQFTDHVLKVKSVVPYFRYFPKAAARVIAAHPEWERMHCEYLAEALGERGEDQVHKLTSNEVLRIAPMASFWGLGLISAMKNAGRISPLTFSIAIGIQYVGVAARSYEIAGEQSRMSMARASLLSGQMDEETWLRYMNSDEQLREEIQERDHAALETVGMHFAATAVARITTYGWRGAWAAAVTPQVVSKYRYSGPLYKFLQERGVRTARDIEKLLAEVSPKELKEIRHLVKDGYEMTLPGLAIALKETLHAFNFGGYDYRELERGL